MPFLTQHRLSGPHIKSKFNIPSGIFTPEYAWQVEESWINLNQLQLHPDIEGKEILFSLETAGQLIGEEIYWLQIETLAQNRVVWRGEQGVFYDASMPSVRFGGSIPLPETPLLTPGTPQVYELHLTLFRGTKLLDRVETSFELRQVVSESGQFYLVNTYGWKPLA